MSSTQLLHHPNHSGLKVQHCLIGWEPLDGGSSPLK